ncbi:Palmitoyl-protein thioesterase 1, partial [Coemansia sp. RSA 1836]
MVTPIADAQAVSRANELKLEANAFYANKQYHEAIDKYTLAIEADPAVPAFFTNRAQCHLLTEGYGAARDDANAALELDPGFIKAYYRRAAALLAMGKLKEARADYREVTKRAPKDAVAHKKHAECDKLYRRIQFEKAIDSDSDRKRVADSVDLSKFPLPEDYTGPRMPLRTKQVPKSSLLDKGKANGHAGGEDAKDAKDAASDKEEEMVEAEEEFVDLEFVKSLADWFRDQKNLPVRYMYAILLQ